MAERGQPAPLPTPADWRTVPPSPDCTERISLQGMPGLNTVVEEGEHAEALSKDLGSLQTSMPGSSNSLSMPTSTSSLPRVPRERLSSIGFSDPAIPVELPPSYGGALDNRISYYRSLTRGMSGAGMPLLEPPQAVLAAAAAALLVGLDPGKRLGSASIIFTVWNTMMGSTLLIMPYCFSVAGWLLATVLAIASASLSRHTALIVVEHGLALPDKNAEFADLAAAYLGRPGWVATLCTSILVLVGAACAMHRYLAMSLLQLLQEETTRGGLGLKEWLRHFFGNAELAGTTLFTLLLVLPLASLPSMRLLARFNIVGVACVVMIILFATVSATLAGFDPSSLDYDRMARPGSTGVLLGIFSLSFFIQNCAITIFRAAAQPNHNRRNMSVAYALVFATYTGVGVSANLCPPLRDAQALVTQGSDSFFSLKQPEAVAGLLMIARLAVVLQCVTVLPVFLFVIRAQLFSALNFASPYPGPWPVLLLNLSVAAVTSAITIGGVHISDVLRFTGAIAAFLCVYAIPACVQWRQPKPARWVRALVLAVLMAVGSVTFVVQFFS